MEADDIIGIYARARRMPLEDALDELFKEGLIEDDRSAFDRYLGQREFHDDIQMLFEDGQQRIRQNAWPAALTVLKGNGIHVEHGHGTEAIAARVGVIHATDIEAYHLDEHHEFGELKRWMGKAACLASPIYKYRTKPEGLFVVNRYGQHRVARLGYGNTKRDRAARIPQATLFPRFIRRDAEAVVVVTEDYEAWKMTMKMCRVSEPLTPIVGVYSSTRRVEPIMDLGHRTQVFWGVDFLSSYYWAEAHNGSQVSTEPWTDEFSALSGQQLLCKIVARGTDRHTAMASHLASLPEDQAYRLVNRLRYSEADLNAIMAAALPVQRTRVRKMIADEDTAEEVVYNGEKIYVGSDGAWQGGSGIGTNGFLISEATIHLNSIVTAGGVPYVTGTVHMQGQTYEFKEKLSQVRKGANWLEAFLVSVGAPLPYVHKKWRTHLYEIALQFHKPDTVAPDRQIGWSDGDDVLTMTNFRVSNEGIQPVDYVTSDFSDSGSALTAPMPLQDGDGELEESLGHETFWYVFTYLASHLLRDRLGCDVPSLVLSGPYAPAWTSAIRRALSLAYNTAVNPQNTATLERRAILPLVIEPVNEDALVAWMRLDGHRAIVAVNGPAVPLMRYKGWLVLEPNEPPPLYVTSLLPQIFWFVVYAIPFLDGLRTDVMRKGPFWPIGNCIASWAIRQPEGSRKAIDAATAALYRAHGVGEQKRDESWQTLRLLRELADGEFIQTREDEHQRYQVISWTDVCEIFSRFRMSVTSYLSVKRKLSPYLYDGRAGDNELLLNYNDWILTGALS